MTWPPNIPLIMCVRTLKRATYSVSGPQGAVILCSHGSDCEQLCTLGCYAVKSISNIPAFPSNIPLVSSDTFIWHASEFLQVDGCSDCALAFLCSFFILYCYILDCSLLHSRICPIFFSGLTDIRFLFVFCLNIRPIHHIRSPGIVVKCNNIFI